MDETRSTLLMADNILEKISVRGSDVYLLVEARKLMKQVYDQLGKEEKTNG